MKKLYLLLLGIFFISLASAIPTYKQGDTIQLTAICDNCTNVNLTQVTYPNGTIALSGDNAMTKNGQNYNYTYVIPYGTLGTYSYVTCGDLNGVITCQDTTDRQFLVTSSGFDFNSVLNNPVIIILCVLGVFLIIAGIYFGWVFAGFSGGVMFLLNGIYIMIYGFNTITDTYTRATGMIFIFAGLIFMFLATYQFLSDSGIFGGRDVEDEEE